MCYARPVRPAASRRRSLRRRRRGAMLPLIAALTPVLLIFLGFAVDLAYMQTSRMELQAVADAAARAGATKLSQTDDVGQARTEAVRIARQNKVAGAALRLRNSDVEVGRSVPDSAGRFQFASGGAPANSVRVNAARTAGSLGGSISLFFGGVVGTRNFEPLQSATASFLNVDVCLVLDRSTSMKLDVSGESGGMFTSDPRFCRPPNARSRWTALDAAVAVFVQELSDSDAVEKVALASYGSDLSGYSPPLCGASSNPSSLDCQLDANLGAVAGAMSRLLGSVWNGNTHIEAGMRTGIAELTSSRARASAEKVMILLTDGNENVGSAMNAARDCQTQRITVHTITFSDDANQTTMRNVAAATDGRHYHAETSAELREVFRELAAQAIRLTQ